MSSFHIFFPKNLQMGVGVARDRDTSPVCVPTTSKKSSDGCRRDEEKHDAREKTKLCIEFVNRVAQTLQDDSRFKLFLDAVNGLWKSKNLVRVRMEVYAILKDHPELEIQFSKFLPDFCEAKPKVEDDAKSNPRRRSAKGEAQYLKIMSECEDKMYKADLKYHSVRSAMESVDQMVKKLETNPNEMVWVEDYFSPLNFKCLREFYGVGRVLEMRRNPIDVNAVASIELDLSNECITVKNRLVRVRMECARTMKEIDEKTYDQESAKRSSPESQNRRFSVKRRRG